MKIIEVKDTKTEKKFLKVPKILYKEDLFWVCPLDDEIRNAFNTTTNVNFKDGEVSRWVLQDSNGELLGRIAAFYSGTKAQAGELRTGRAGYFECVNDQQAAALLFDTAKNWLRERGFQAMDCPVSPGENDSNWGLLVEGFTHPAYGMPYHLPYYRSLFENYGFNIYFKQYSYHLDLNKKFPERFWKIAEWICRKPGFSFRHFRWSESDKFINDLVYIYNVAWKDFKKDFTPLNPSDVRASLKKAKPILDPELVWFAYYDDEPIGFFIMFPDVNQILKKLNGNSNFFNKLRFLYYKKTGTITRIRAQVAGVVPKYRNSGVESGIFRNLRKVMDHKPWYKEIELSWVGDFNPKMIALYEAVGGKRAKTHHTYRYMIDKTVPFERYMVEMTDVPLTRKKAKQIL